MALMGGSRVIATAGETFADRLRGLGATVTPYGDGMVERVLQLTSRSPDLILDTAPVSGVLPALIKIAGDPQRVLTIVDFAAGPRNLGCATASEESLPCVMTSWANSHSLLRTAGLRCRSPARFRWTTGARRSTSAKAKKLTANLFCCLKCRSGLDGFTMVSSRFRTA